MDLLKDTILLAQRVGVTESDVKSLGLTWRWYTKVRDGLIPNPGVNNVTALRRLAEEKAAQLGSRKGAAA